MSIPHPQFDRYRLVLLCPRRRLVLLEESASRFSLPQLLVPRWTRAARNVTRLIRERWAIRATIVDFLGDHPGGGNVVIAAHVDERRERQADTRIGWHPLHALAEGDLNEEELFVIRRLLDVGATGRGPFSRMDWIEDLLGWACKALRLERSQLSDETVQLNAAADAALVHISERTGPGYWFKAAGRSHPNERQITETLTMRCPEYLPEIIAVHDEWNGWLMRDAGIPLLSSGSSISTHAVGVVRRLGELQAATASCVEELLFIGSHDHRLPALRAQIRELTPCLEEAMREPEAHVGTRIESARLRSIATLAVEATLRLEDTGVPDTLLHCDIGFENILLGADRCVFIDWAQASVGHPFITFENLCSQFAQDHEVRNLVPRIRKAYLEAWDARLLGERHRQALASVPLVTLATLLCCRREWLTGSQKRRSSSQSYARVLARQMDLAARRIEDIRAVSSVRKRLIA